jgi:biopolymer transport protein TolQ
MELGTLLLQLGTGGRTSIPALIAHASLFSKFILLVLLVQSVVSWAIVWNRVRTYQRVRRQDQGFLAAWRRLGETSDCRLVAEQHPASVLARTALAGQRALEQLPADRVPREARMELGERAMDRAASDEVTALERHVGFLATTGSVAPFVGLLGTVWGVMVAFVDIGAQGSATLVVVAPGIAEALIATVAGLAAAIPAVIGYNHCLGQLRDFGHAAGQFAGEFLDRRLGAELR